MHENERDHLTARLREHAAEIGAAHDVGTERGQLLALIHLGLALVRRGADPNDLSIIDHVAPAFADDEVVEAASGLVAVAEFDGGDVTESPAHDLFAAIALRAPDIAGVHVALARSREAAGELASMEAALRRALRLDPDARLANGDLGELAALRGQFRAARRHFDRAGRPPLGLAAVAANIGWGPIRGERNARCPCGSGARFKRCCLETDGWPLDARVRLLPARLADWVDRPAWVWRRLRFAAAVFGVDDIVDDPDRVVQAALTSAMVALYLFEGEGIGRLVREVGPVLRTDESAVLAHWTDCRHDLYEVLRTTPGGTSIRLVRTGEVGEVAALDADLFEGDHRRMLAVVVPGARRGHGDWVLGGEPIPLADDRVDEVEAILRVARDPIALSRAVVGPILEFQRAIGTIGPRRDQQRDERLRWLFGDRIQLECVRNLDDVDDLVTTMYMSGGGFTHAADHVRWTARQIVEAEPPEVWAMAKELTAAGYDRQTVLVHLACAWAAAIQRAPDPDAVRAAHLAHLRSVPTRVATERIRHRRGGSP